MEHPAEHPRLADGDTPSLLDDSSAVWRVANADRLAFIIDAADYFAAFAQAVAEAERSILILAWDIDSELRLVRPQDDDQRPATFANLMEEVLSAKPSLEAHVLCWDFAMIYALERELLPRLKMGWNTHQRLHFSLDGRHPAGASHHQKIVVVDDRLAFIGGMDLGRRRWDTSDHRPNDPRRVSPAGHSYAPFHDLQAAVSGEIAAVLGDLARDRWRRATGETIEPPARSGDLWLPSLEVAARDVPVGVVRTIPESEDRTETRETECFHCRAIAEASNLIYIENQYLTSAVIGDALEARLSEDDPPEIVIVTTRENEGWLEQNTLGRLRALLVQRLREADHHDRLRVYYPSLDDGSSPTVHSKLLIADDMVAYLGSANLSNRSMGLDTEAGIGIEAAGRADIVGALRGLRVRLLAEHLDVSAKMLDRSEENLIATIESLAGGARTLRRLDADPDDWDETAAAITSLADPERPVKVSAVLDELLQRER